MNTIINYSLASLFEFAVPTKGSYANYIGSVVFGDYNTLTMTQTGTVVVGTNTYQMIQGYILVKPLAEQYKKINKDAKLKRVDHW